MDYSEVDSVLTQLAAKILDDAGIEGPPVDSMAVARSVGATVAIDPAQKARGILCGPRKRPKIYLRADDREERLYSTAAHEVAELLMPDIADMLCADGYELDARSAEDLAQRFIGLLLCPRPWFEDDCRRCGFSLPELKKIYCTASNEVIARRMLHEDQPTIVTICDPGNTMRLHNLTYPPPPMQPVEARAQREAHEGEAVVYTEGEMTVRAWPIHEPGWKREILRTTFDFF